jgi:thioredoxin
MRELDGGSFDGAIGGEPIVVDFWAPWCKPCRALEPVLEQLSARVSVARLNVDEHPEISARYDVLSIPTVLAFADGQLRGTIVGVRPLSQFETWLAEVLPAPEVEGVAAQPHFDA